MSQRAYASIAGLNAPAYIAKEVLERAAPHVCLDLACDRKPVPRKQGAFVNFRRWINPAINATPNPEGVTPASRALTHQDYNVQMDRYAEVFEESRYNADLDPYDSIRGASDVLADLIVRTRERVRWNGAKAGSNVIYNSSAISARNTVNGAITLGRIQKITRAINAAKGMHYTKLVKASTSVSTAGIRPSYFGFGHTDMKYDFDVMPGFKHLEELSGIPAEAKGNPNLYGAIGEVLVFLSPELVPFEAAGALVGSTGMKSVGGVSIDVYPFLVCAQHSMASMMLRGDGANGFGALNIKVLDQPDKSDPTGERIYIPAAWYDAHLRTAEEWLWRGEFGVTDNPA
jgi:N4-gp56 family major capsid protein